VFILYYGRSKTGAGGVIAREKERATEEGRERERERRDTQIRIKTKIAEHKSKGGRDGKDNGTRYWW